MTTPREVGFSFVCTLDWAAMTPADKGRFCGDCKKVVRDLSRLTEAEGRALIEGPKTEGLCVRYVADAQGRIFFADGASSSLVAPSLLVRAKRAIAAAALALPAAACDVTNLASDDGFMGAIAEPYTPPQDPGPGADDDGGDAGTPREAGADGAADARDADVADAGPDVPPYEGPN